MGDITSNLVAHWKLDETSGTNAADSTGNGYGATYTNSPTLNVTGAFSGSTAVTFASASSQYAPIGTLTGLLNNVSAITLACWLKTSKAAAMEAICVSTGTSSSARRAAIRTTASGNIRCYAIAGDAETNQFKTTSSTFHNGAWHHAVGVIDFAGDTITLYIDNSAVAQTGTIAFTASATSATDPLGACVAALGSGASGYFDGSLDDVRIYSRALSSDDVATLYAYTGAAGPLVNASKLLTFAGQRLIRN